MQAMSAAPGKNAMGVVSRVAKEEGITEAVLRKAIKLAKSFNVANLQEYCSLRTPSGNPLSVSLAYRLMYLPNRQTMMAVARLAAAGDWSARDVEAEVKRRSIRPSIEHKGGRLPRLPEDRTEALRQLAERCESWERWIRCMEPSEQDSPQFDLAQFPPSVRAKLKTASEAIESLKQQVRKVEQTKGA
ncbi:hypothetical protein NA78x_002887 [Anatilimnocola sp. NA78]|uniref:hypothetical protein n=1 Tax=Anatilimnocola sp. NA78 TaxID=3415683 RepID=UPI003CE45286